MRPFQTLLYSTSAALVLLSATGYSQVSNLGLESTPEPIASMASVSEDSPSQPSVIEGTPQSLGNGTIRTYVALDGHNYPQEVGVIITEEALTELPQEGTELLLPLPFQAESTAIDHIALDWRPHGHPPEPIYGDAHFDIHAYTITPAEREAITAQGADLEKTYKTPAPEYIPAGYVLAPDSAEPRMGAHWVAPTAAEFQGHPHGFEHTLIYGFYNGAIAFIEPMVSLDFLASQQDFEGAFALPQSYARRGLYPTRYRVAYSEATQEYVVALTNFSEP
ncbi:DUF5602 domain-containing protein [Nodosilinea sp. LEGE 06152]|uniref:DUF5602 domain-containing protein n=1 Tax=Nodosilinea sp. LEGE 06152 TaxID=2777966 RepID=UPI00187F5FED|nr:DUF5602 domain-containing protein [Nodosilinea sp. LEGE 06152]MBE9160387.1 DUF5602 domain-containing protein [Nodosilinea sp. LEGE 06152]